MFKVQAVTGTGRAIKGQCFNEVPAEQVETARASLRRDFPIGSSRQIKVTRIR
jgi:hypothetical protein